jgi:hypothetical protein
MKLSKSCKNDENERQRDNERDEGEHMGRLYGVFATALGAETMAFRMRT